MLLALLFTVVLNRIGLFKELETTVLDAQMKMDLPAGESDVVIVDITEEDFQRVFKGQTRPLNPTALQELVEAIAAGHPCVIGVDADTSFDQFKDFHVSEKYKLTDFVWSRSAEISDDAEQNTVPLKVLGRQDPTLEGKSGLPILEDDDKGITRFYSRLVKTTQGDLPSFAWAVFKEGKSRKCEGIKFPDLEETTEPLIISYSRGAEGAGRTRIPAAQILKFAEHNWQNDTVIRNKIVLLGGSYLSEDKSDTPLGPMNGVEITANVIESDLRGKSIKPPAFLSIILLQIFDGILLITMFQLFSWRKAALLSLPLIIVLSLVCSVFTYHSFSHWAFFVPVMIGIALTELFEDAREHFKHRYRREITKTYQEFSGHPPGEEQKAPDDK